LGDENNKQRKIKTKKSHHDDNLVKNVGLTVKMIGNNNFYHQSYIIYTNISYLELFSGKFRRKWGIKRKRCILWIKFEYSRQAG